MRYQIDYNTQFPQRLKFIFLFFYKMKKLLVWQIGEDTTSVNEDLDLIFVFVAFRDADPSQHILDTLEQCISVIIEKIQRLDQEKASNSRMSSLEYNRANEGKFYNSLWNGLAFQIVTIKFFNDWKKKLDRIL